MSAPIPSADFRPPDGFILTLEAARAFLADPMVSVRVKGGRQTSSFAFTDWPGEARVFPTREEAARWQQVIARHHRFTTTIEEIRH